VSVETNLDADPLPDLSKIQVGHEVTAYYASQRSGNEVDRTGTVTAAMKREDGGNLIRYHVEQRDCFKHSYVALTETELASGEEAVAAFSLTAEADPPEGGDPPTLAKMYMVEYESVRTSLLGIVDRVVREDGPGPHLVTDGGQRRC